MRISVSVWVIIAAVIIGGGVGIYMGMKRKSSLISGNTRAEKKGEGSDFKKNSLPWEVLMRSQKSVDILVVSDILAWVEEVKNGLGEGETLFLFKATKANVEKIGYIFPKQIDSNTNVIACVIDTENARVRNIQLFTFGSASEKVEELFAGSDYAVISV